VGQNWIGAHTLLQLMHLKDALLIATATLTTSACTTTADLVNQRLASILETERAYVVGTYAVDCTPRDSKCFHAFNSISTYYRSVSDKDIRGRLNWTTGSILGTDTTHDYIASDRKEKGFHFCIALPPGKYEVYTYDFYNFAGGGSGYSIREEGQFKLPFSFAAGQVVDVGKLHITTSTGKNFFGMSLPAPGILLLSDSTSEASAAALSKCPASIRSRPIHGSSLTASGYRPSPFVRVLETRRQPQ
jgi:hypothetical protein